MTIVTLDFEKYDYELFQDWQENPVKRSFVSELEKRAVEEKNALPKLLSNGDLRKRWNMENRQSVHNIVRRKQFPDPVVVFSDGKTPLYLETEVQVYEINYPWILSPESRQKYAYWILKNVINN